MLRNIALYGLLSEVDSHGFAQNYCLCFISQPAARFSIMNSNVRFFLGKFAPRMNTCCARDSSAWRTPTIAVQAVSNPTGTWRRSANGHMITSCGATWTEPGYSTPWWPVACRQRTGPGILTPSASVSARVWELRSDRLWPGQQNSSGRRGATESCLVAACGRPTTGSAATRLTGIRRSSSSRSRQRCRSTASTSPA